MKFNAIQKYPFTADYYEYTIIGAGEAAQFDYYFDHIITFAGTMTQGERFEIYNTEPLKIGARIDNIKSMDGSLVFPVDGGTAQGLSYRVSSFAPRLNPFGFHEGYKHVLVRG